jgi:hypothetical protein
MAVPSLTARPVLATLHSVLFPLRWGLRDLSVSGRNNAVGRNAVDNRILRSSAGVIVAAMAVALAAMSAPRVHVLAGARAARSAFGTFVGAPTTLTDETVSVPMASSRGVPIRVPFPGVLQLQVNVAGAARVNVHVIGSADWEAFRKSEGRLLSGRFRFDFPEFQALAAAQARLSGRVWEGSYFVVVENPTLGPTDAPPYSVHVRASLRP